MKLKHQWVGDSDFITLGDTPGYTKCLKNWHGAVFAVTVFAIFFGFIAMNQWIEKRGIFRDSSKSQQQTERGSR